MPVRVATPRAVPSPLPAQTKSFMFLMNLLTKMPIPNEIIGYTMTIAQSTAVKFVSANISILKIGSLFN